jgi:outer membrane receptor protein involved in Fe transport
MLSHCLRRADSADRTFHLIPLLGLILLLAAPLALAEETGSEEAAEPEAPAAVVAPDEPDEALPAHQVGPVTVTATRAERDVLEVPGNVTVIDREEIERSGVRTVPELLRRESGVFVTNTTTNRAGYTVDSRGFNNGGGNGSNTLIQVDGRRVNESDSSIPDWSMIPLDEIESIEIVRGAASALYGDNAAGGVINIRTRPREGQPRASLRGRVGRYGSGGGSLNAAGSLGSVTGELFIDGFTTNGYRDQSDFETLDFKGSLEWNIAERVLIGGRGGYHEDFRALPGSLTQEEIDDLGRRAVSPNNLGDEWDVDQGFFHGWIEGILADAIELRIQPFYRTRSDDAEINHLVWGETLIDSEKEGVGVDVQLLVDRQLFGMSNRLIVGGEFLHDEVERLADYEFFPGGPRAQTLSGGDRDVYAVFLQEEIQVLDNLLIAAGVRFDRALLDIFSVDVGSGERATKEPDYSVWSPKASITYRALPTLSVYAAYARGFRIPSLDEDLPVVGWPLPDLDLQVSDSIEVGVKQRSERIDASVAVYYMNVRDEVIWDQLSFANMNFDRVRHIGVETAFALQILEWLSIYGSYTFEDVEIREAHNPDFEGEKMPITPTHRGTAGLLTTLPYDLEFGVNANLVGERILASDFDRELPKLDAYATIDFLMAWRPKFGEHLEGALTLALRNVAGEEFDDFGARFNTGGEPTSYFYPAPKRTWEVGFMLTLRR